MGGNMALFDEWQGFLDNLRDLCHHRLQKPDRAKYRSLQGIVDDVIDKLKHPDACKAVIHAIDTANRNPDNQVVNGLLEREIKFFNELIANSRGYGGEISMTEEEVNDGLGAGETIKDSFEDLLDNLPEWVKKLLRILNELLSIIRGGN